jgi:ferredoxin
MPIFAAPLMGVSQGDDPLFEKLKEVVARDHLTPREMWIRNGLADDGNISPRLRILSVVFPFAVHIREQCSKNDKPMPLELYCLARNLANPFMDQVLALVKNFFMEEGYRATAGMGSRTFEVTSAKDSSHFYSNWSERHIAFAAGLGTFSLPETFITEVGCNIRLTSIITDAPLTVTPRSHKGVYGNCLHYADGTCGECISKCPVHAITREGHDKRKCSRFVRKMREKMEKRPVRNMMKPHYQRLNGIAKPVYRVGCALCQFGVPCTDKNPVAGASRDLS